jgi:hypothetical protein
MRSHDVKQEATLLRGRIFHDQSHRHQEAVACSTPRRFWFGWFRSEFESIAPRVSCIADIYQAAAADSASYQTIGWLFVRANDRARAL